MELANFPYSLLFCKFLRPLSTLVLFVSIFTITAMALERHQVITKPFHLKMTQKSALLVIGGIWVLAVIFVVPLPIVTSTGVSECEEEWPAIIYRNIYTAILVVFQYLLPLTIITTAYIRIAVYLWNERASQRALNIQGDVVLRTARKNNMQVVKAVVIVVIVFAVCLFPSQLAWLLWEFGKAKHQDIAQRLLKFSPITSYLQSCANPIIYGTFMAYFRKEFKLWLAEFASCCHGFRCFRRRRGNMSPFRVSSAYSETSQQHNNNATNDIISINSEAYREQEVRGVTKHKELLENEIGGQKKIGFTKEESVENEPDFQETRF
ncbi:RYamide receptor-like [Oculina patagonica]